MTPPCPHCGEPAPVYAVVQVFGYERWLFNGSGFFLSIEPAGVTRGEPGPLRCQECGRVREDLALAPASAQART